MDFDWLNGVQLTSMVDNAICDAFCVRRRTVANLHNRDVI